MLYLLPGVAHHGVARGACMTFSIGFRAPAYAEMLADLSGRLLARLDTNDRYSDPGLSSADADPGLIPKNTRTALRRKLRAAQSLHDAELDEWFGCFITEPKPWLAPAPPRRKLTPAQLRKRLAASGKLQRDPAALLAWYNAGPATGVKLYANGQCHTLRLTGLARMLCAVRSYPAAQLESWRQDPQAVGLLTALCNAGILHFK